MKFSLRTLLIVPFLLQVIGITGLVAYLSYRSGQRAVTNLAERLMMETSDRLEQGLEQYFEAPISLTEEHQSAIRLGLLDWQNQPLVTRYFVDQLTRHADVSGVMITTEAKDFLAIGRSQPDPLTIRIGNPQTGGQESYAADSNGNRLFLKEVVKSFDPHASPAADPWYQAAKDSDQGFWRPTVSLVRGRDQPTLMMAYFLPFTDAQGNFQGVLSTSLFLDQVGEFLRQIQRDDARQSFIMDEQGRLIATSTYEAPFRLNPASGQAKSLNSQDWQFPAEQSQDPVTSAAARLALGHSPLTKPEINSFKFRLEGNQYLGRAAPFTLHDQLDWAIVVVMPESELMADIHANILRTAMLCGLALLASIGLGLWTAEYITKPIISLNQAIQAVTDGLSVVPPTQPSQITEVETLRQGFDQMVAQLVTSFRALTERGKTLTTFLNGVPIAVSVHARSGKILFLNQKGKELLFSQENSQTNPMTKLSATSEEMAETFQLYVAGTDQLYPTEQLPAVRGLRGETTYVDDLEIKTETGRIPLEVHTIPVLDTTGQVVYAINAFQDISERQQAERLRANYELELVQRVAEQTASLAQSEATKQALINAMPDLLMRVGRDGVPLEIYNLDAVPWLYKIKPFNPSMLIYWPESIAQERQHCVQVALATRSPQRQEYEFTRNGQVYCEEARIVPVTPDEVLVVVRDISERRQINRLKDEFISIVSHELRTPLAAIRGSLGILESGVLQDRPHKAQHMLQMALSNTERLIRLVNDILDLERLESGQVVLAKELCQITDLIQLSLDGVEALALEAGITFHIQPLDASIWAAPDSIVQVLTNLLSNAIKFSSTGGNVWLGAKLLAVDAEPLAPWSQTPDLPQHNLRPPGGSSLIPCILFSVKDQGRGIPADRLGAIFDRFQQVDVSDSRQKGGTGLGLAISSTIVKQHGGEIWVESQLGEGSTFYFTLPAKKV